MSSTKYVTLDELRTAALGVSLGALSYLGEHLPLPNPEVVEFIDSTSGYGYAGSVVVVSGAVASSFWRRSRTARRRTLFRADGWAGPHDVADTIGAKGIRKVGDQVRPSLAKRATRNGHKPVPTDYGQPLGRIVTGVREVRGKRAYVGFESCLLVVAPPGMGKTSLILHGLLDAPGAVLAASTKPDLYLLTRELRAERGPIYLFNPQNVANLPGNFRWDPLSGCENYDVAVMRAKALVSGTKGITGMQEASWAEKCEEILAKYLMAARLAEKDLSAVGHWLANPADETAVRILRHFTEHGSVPQGWASWLEAEMRSEADRMKGSIWSLARGAVGFMSHPLVSAACGRGAGESFDAATFARSGGTFYLVGDDQDETIAPLLSALTDYIYQEVRRSATIPAEEARSGDAVIIDDATGAATTVRRLDPPFQFFLDEVAKITPVPIDKWAADARAYGIAITAVTQSFDQIRARWGEHGSGAIKSVFCKAILGGLQNLQDLEELSKLIGTRLVETVSEGESEGASGRSRSRNVTTRREAVLPPEEIRKLPLGHVLLLIERANAAVTKFSSGQVRAEKALAKLRKSKAKAASGAPQTVGQPDGYITPPVEHVDQVVGEEVVDLAAHRQRDSA